MPCSYTKFDRLTQAYVRSHVPVDARILDVGPGAGHFCDLLPEYPMDCVEVFEPYVNRFHLRRRYDAVTVAHVCDVTYPSGAYALVIFGDVIEHLSIHEARIAISRAHQSGARTLVTIPYRLSQGTVEDNVYECHLQPDLTPEVMAERYPDLGLLHRDETYGAYVGPSLWTSDWKPRTI